MRPLLIFTFFAAILFAALLIYGALTGFTGTEVVHAPARST